MTIHIGPDVFEMERDLIDVTSLHRPDVSRVPIDAHGHQHPWCTPNGKPATFYRPDVQYHIPSLVWIKDGEEYYDGDDEPHDVGHYECKKCGDRVIPPFTADSYQMFAPGMLHCRINGREVSKDEFDRRRIAAAQKAGHS